MNIVNRYAAALTVVAGIATLPAMAQDTASTTFGPYARGSLGLSLNAYDDAQWQNGMGDPTISFNLSDDTVGFGEIALGYDWQNGFRADLALGYFGDADATGPCSGVSNGTPCSDHADISGATINSTTVMGNLFFSPMEYRGDDATFQPYVSLGLGMSRNELSDWTRAANPGSPSTRPFRTFEGDTETSFAWSVGVGASWQVSRAGQYPVLLEASWRYFDLGDVTGGATPLPGNGGGTPIDPFSFSNTRNVFSIGLRIPLQRL